MISKAPCLLAPKPMFPSVASTPAPAEWTLLTYPDGTTVRVQVQADTTVIELFQAELALSQDATSDQWIDAATGLPLDYYTRAGLNILVQGARHAAASSSTDAVPTAVSSIPIPLDFGDVDSVPVDAPSGGMDVTEAVGVSDEHLQPVLYDCPPATVPSGIPLAEVVDFTTQPGHVMDTSPSVWTPICCLGSSCGV